MALPQADATHSSTLTAWLAAAVVAAIGTWLCFDALPGINWPIWTAVAALGLIWFAQRGRLPTTIMAGFATILAGGAAITAAEHLHVIILFSVIVLFAMAMLLSAAPYLSRVTPGFTIAAPIVAFTNAILSAISRAIGATQLIRSPRASAALRGLALTVPVVIAFALLLSAADPTFASWRNAIRDLVANWDFVPRTIFFIALMGLSLGAYGYALDPRGDPDPDEPGPQPARRWFGAVERSMLLGSVTALLWLFLLLQMSYLFGNLPSLPGSGVTFAEYARRGFGELTVVAAGSALLIIMSERFGQQGDADRMLRSVTYALMVAVLLLLGSAFYRVLLYEEAYGFTTARLYAQAFMFIIAAGLLFLTLEIRGELDPGRLFRRVASVAALVLAVLIYWNHEAWIANRNIDRHAVTGKLDVAYLTRDLSQNAIPVVVERIPTLAEPVRSELREALARRYAERRRLPRNRWFEWNLGRSRARESLQRLGITVEENPATRPLSTQHTRPRTQP